MTTKFTVVGSPIEHSLSPLLHQTGYELLGLEYEYEKHEVSLGQLREFFERNSFAGASITMPLKQEAYMMADSLGEEAKITGVANTLYRHNTGLRAENTDVFGIQMALGSIPSPSSALIMGSGATAKSATLALSRLFPSVEIIVMARNHQSAQESLDFAKGLNLVASMVAPNPEALLAADLVMSLVPSGSYPELWAEISKQSTEGILFDVAYNPWPSIQAKSWSSEVISGIEMLIWQAIAQLEFFTESVGDDVLIDRSKLYSALSAAVSAK